MDHTENSLRAVVTSLRTIVAPALDPGDALAAQQLGLSILYLEFLGSRVGHLPDRDRFEVAQNARLAEAVAEVSGERSLTDAAAWARAVADRPGATREQLQHAAAVVAARVSELIDGELPDDVRPAVESAVVANSAERVEFDRAWYAPMGFDPAPASIVPLSEFVAPPGDDPAARVEVAP